MPPEKNEKPKEQGRKVVDVVSALRELWRRRFFLRKEVEQSESQQITDLVKKAEKQSTKTLTVVHDLDKVKHEIRGGPVLSEIYSIRSLDGGKRCVLQFIERHNGIIDGGDKGTTYMMVKKGKVWEKENVRMDDVGSESFKPFDKVNAHPKQKTPAEIIEELQKGPIQNDTTHTIEVMSNGEGLIFNNIKIETLQSQSELARYNSELREIITNKYDDQDIRNVRGPDKEGDEMRYTVTRFSSAITIGVSRINRVEKDKGKKTAHILEVTYSTRHELQNNGGTWRLSSSDSASARSVVDSPYGKQYGRPVPATAKRVASVQDVIDVLR